ncbi:hypothetical protein BaRGS_00024265 [Batillaria attramentaria]|uniref:cAMP-regulated phosphoprotein 19 n=1 Tax=Batillaria attramentaria TaxID=370345 RepID=A0ABD0KBL7_9CAEN
MSSEEGSSPAQRQSGEEGKEQGGGDKQPDTRKTLEQREEEKLKSKYPNLRGGGGGPAMLHKRLIQKGASKYFDSGDYNMAKAAMKKPLPPQEKMLLQESIGEGIPTPEDLPPRKPSIVQSKLASGALS